MLRQIASESHGLSAVPGPLQVKQLEEQVQSTRTAIGCAIHNLIPGLEQISLFTQHHDEDFDGSGYPGDLRGSEIPIGSRIVTVIDAFDAMISNRPYRQVLPVEEAIRRLVKDSVTQFDP